MREGKRTNQPFPVRNLLLLPRSVFDLLQSVAMLLSTIPISSHTFGSYGNESSCKAQNFIYQLGLAVPSYNCMHCIYSLNVIKWNRHDDEMRRYVPIMHLFSIGLPLFSGLLVATVNEYFHGFAVSSCIIDNSNSTADSTASAKPVVSMVLNMATLIYVWLIFITILVCMIKIFRTIRETEAKMRRYSFQRPDGSDHSSSKALLSRNAAINGFLYVASFLSSYSFPTVIIVMQSMLNVPVPYTIFLLRGIFMPTQGFWNFLAYIRPQIIHHNDGRCQVNVFRRIWQIVTFNKNADEPPSLLHMMHGSSQGRFTLGRRLSSLPGTIENIVDAENIDVENINVENIGVVNIDVVNIDTKNVDADSVDAENDDVENINMSL